MTYDDGLSDEDLGRILASDDPSAALGVLADRADVQATLAAVRDAEDGLPPARRDEDRIADARARLDAGTYVAPMPGGPDPGHCGPSDDFGRCASPQHEMGCSSVTVQAAATGSYDAVVAWRKAVGRHPGPVPLRPERPERPKYPDVSGLARSLRLTGNNPNADERTRIGADLLAQQAVRAWPR